MRTIAEILLAKPDQTLYATTPSAPALEAAAAMVDANVGALVVMDRGELVGLVTERDFVRHAQDIASAPVPPRVRDVMSSPVSCAKAGCSSDECMAMMTALRQRHVPVLRDRTLVGVVSIGDLVKEALEDQQFTIEQLERYIAG
jgi:CBS domain-containing protein